MSWGLDLPFSTKPVGLRLLSTGLDSISSKLRYWRESPPKDVSVKSCDLQSPSQPAL